MRRKLEERYFIRLVLFGLVILAIFTLGGFAELQERNFELPDFQSLGPVRSIMWFIISLLPVTMLNSIPSLVALVAIPWLASRFIRTLYDAEDLSEAHGFLHRNVFGSTRLRPIMIVKEGQIAVGKGSFFDRVGGWGFVTIHNDSAVVMERGGCLKRVEGPGLTFLKPFERIWDVIDLRPQRWVLNVEAMTKDGLPVEWEAEVTFKIDDRYIDATGNIKTKEPEQSKSEKSMQKTVDLTLEKSSESTSRERFMDDAEIDAAIIKELGTFRMLPHTEKAIFRAATSAWMRIRQPDHPEQLRTWMGRVVVGQVEGKLRSIISNYRLDWLVQTPRPDQKHPRDEIGELLKNQVAQAFPVGNRVGVRVLDIALGNLDSEDVDISEQWIDAWHTSWEQRAIANRAEGEAELAQLNAAEVQARAEMVLTLTEAIRPLVNNEEELSSYTLATRFVETLWWMSYAPWRRSFLPPDAIKMLDSLEKALGNELPPEPPLFPDQYVPGQFQDGEK
jgi:hypothetical protein